MRTHGNFKSIALDSATVYKNCIATSIPLPSCSFTLRKALLSKRYFVPNEKQSRLQFKPKVAIPSRGITNTTCCHHLCLKVLSPITLTHFVWGNFSKSFSLKSNKTIFPPKLDIKSLGRRDWGGTCLRLSSSRLRVEQF